ncbi:MAG TPA: hypothetical protein VK846_15940 [Candidatus Limnocylindria bacterium]|nr:hypothetical protein [Candidatus Limnocylindria bacterium]
MLKFGTEVSIVDSELNKFMKIEQNFPVATRENVQNISPSHTRQSSHSLTSLDASSRIEEAKMAAPDARAEEVARGKALIADPNYPSQEQVQRISSLLAAHWSPSRCTRRRGHRKH